MDFKKFLFGISLFVGIVLAAAPPMIPSLNWEVRSDWVTVKTPKTWHNLIAKGDGKNDDTAAIQMTIANAKVKGGTVYLPPGRYRITDTILAGTLQEGSDTRPSGFSIIGHGRDTVIVWDGPKDRPMFRLLGLTWSRIVGVTFDGVNRASAAIDMGGPAFQGHNLFRHCAFLNCRFAGIDTGRHKMQTACTEQRIDNCLFENCGRGVSLGDFNDMDCVIEGCEFRKCGYGIWTFKGNFYCRDTHFENSRISDVLYESEHTSTLRRCTSIGSKQFLIAQTPHCATVLQDCHVSGWTGEAAISQNIVPMLMFDCKFTGRGGNSNVIRFRRMETENYVPSNKLANSEYYKLISSNNRISNAKLYKSDKKVKIYEIPAGKAKEFSSKLTSKTSFLKTETVTAAWTDKSRTVAMPGKIFDVKRDFGAKGGEHDDTDAFKRAIAAAKAHGNGAMVYIPRGHYTIRETLVLDGDNWIFGGSGLESRLSWYGVKDGTLLHVKAPKQVMLENFEILRMGGRKDGIDILQTGRAGHPTLAVYDTVRAFGFLTPQPLVRGIHFRELGPEDKALSLGTFGNLRFVDSQSAEILINNHYEGVLRVEGKSPERTGITAVQFTLLEICDPCIWVMDNNSLVVTDFYNEQCEKVYRFEGNGSPLRGRVSLGSIKVEGTGTPTQKDIPKIFDGFSGEITLGTPQFYNNNLNRQSRLLNVNGGKTDLLLLGGYFFTHSLHWTPAEGFQVRFLATGGGPDKNYSAAEFLKTHADSSDDAAITQASNFLDDMRRVGKLDLELNYPGVK